MQLAEHLGVTRQAAGQMVDELSRLGLVERRRDPQDARLRRVVLTAQDRRARRPGPPAAHAPYLVNPPGVTVAGPAHRRGHAFPR